MIKAQKTNSGHLSKYLGILKDDERSADEMISEVEKGRKKSSEEMEDRQKRFKSV